MSNHAKVGVVESRLWHESSDEPYHQLDRLLFGFYSQIELYWLLTAIFPDWRALRPC